MFKPFYIHGQRLPRKGDSCKQRSLPRAFTAYISPSPDKDKVFLQVVFCAYKDQFIKRLGRLKVQFKDVVELKKADLANYLFLRQSDLYTVKEWNDFEKSPWTSYNFVNKHVEF